MANSIVIKRGNQANLPLLAEGEFAFALDTKKLYIGTGKENVPVNGTEESSSVLDFDVLSNAKGYSCVTTGSNGNCTETITKTSTKKKAAVKTTTKLSNGYRETTTFYEENGTTVKETRTKTITKTSSGYSETIT